MFNSFTYVIYITFHLSPNFFCSFFVFCFLFFVFFFFHVYSVLNDYIFLEKKRSESQQDRIWKGILGIRDLTEL